MKLSRKDYAVLGGYGVLGTMAFPGFAAAYLLFEYDPDEGELDLTRTVAGLLFSTAIWPVAVPLAVTVGPIFCWYRSKLPVDDVLHRYRTDL